MQKMRKTIEGRGSDLFICFTSRPSASSSSTTAAAVRVPSSKSLMSPNRAGASIPSLSSSLSRRLRSSGSIKGGQSPMFPAAGGGGSRKKGVAFEAAEPSSPKVTCIGQVRVKSKRKKCKSAAAAAVARTRSGREASFRRAERKAVSFCDALACFAPCGWPACASSEHSGREERRKRKKPSSSSSSCGAVFARWLMAIEEDGEEKGREVVEERERGRREVGVFVREKEAEPVEIDEFLLRRRDDIFERNGDVVVVEKEVEEESEEEETKTTEEEKARVSVCVPPPNALLLMRCRSDPVRMAALANRFWDSPAMKIQHVEVKDDEEDDVQEEEEVGKEEERLVEEDCGGEVEGEVGEAQAEQASLNTDEVEKGVILGDEKVEALEEEKKIIVAEDVQQEVAKEVEKVISSHQVLALVEEKEKVEATNAIDKELIEKEKGEKEELYVQRGEGDEKEEVEIIFRRSISCSITKSNEFAKAKEGAKRRSSSYREKKEKRRHSFSTEQEARRPSFASEKEARRSSFSVDKDGRRRWSFSVEKENLGPKSKPIVGQSPNRTKKEELPATEKEKPAKTVEPRIVEETLIPALAVVDEGREKVQVSRRDEARDEKSKDLPECLLLMMYEPKLSMEVSKETWVCSTDFRWRPNYLQPSKAEAKNKVFGGGETEDKPPENKSLIPAAANAPPIAQPPPSKTPPAPATLSMTEQKLLKNAVVGPLLPPPQHFVLTRCKSEPLKSSARLAPDAWFWKSRHQPIGAGGIGF